MTSREPEDTAPEPGAEAVPEKEAEPKPPPRSGLNRKRTIIGAVVAILFLAVVFARVIPQIGDYSQAGEYLKSMSAGAVVSLVAVVLLYLFVYGWPFVAATPGLRYRDAFVVNQSAFAVSNGIPGGGAFGLGLQYAQLATYKTSPTAATAAIGATGVWSVFLSLGLPVTGIAAYAAVGDDASKYAVAAVIGLAILIAVIGTFALILKSERGARRVGDFCSRIANPVVRKLRHGQSMDLTPSVLRLRHDTVGLVRRRWVAITAAQIAVSWAQFAILYTALVGVTGSTGAVPLLGAYGSWAISQLGIMIPITPGGLGTVDAALIALLSAAGIDAGAATAADLVWRASSYIPQMAIGLISIFYWRWQVQRNRKLASSAGRG
ncbi:MAG: YbhN family protein [Candidatus Nanopelagicales bacterium]|nr:YbhN family protein [Candidatus Nanopelagicales bacterium]